MTKLFSEVRISSPGFRSARPTLTMISEEPLPRHSISGPTFSFWLSFSRR